MIITSIYFLTNFTIKPTLMPLFYSLHHPFFFVYFYFSPWRLLSISHLVSINFYYDYYYYFCNLIDSYTVFFCLTYVVSCSCYPSFPLCCRFTGPVIICHAISKSINDYYFYFFFLWDQSSHLTSLIFIYSLSHYPYHCTLQRRKTTSKRIITVVTVINYFLTM